MKHNPFDRKRPFPRAFGDTRVITMALGQFMKRSDEDGCDGCVAEVGAYTRGRATSHVACCNLEGIQLPRLCREHGKASGMWDCEEVVKEAGSIRKQGKKRRKVEKVCDHRYPGAFPCLLNDSLVLFWE